MNNELVGITDTPLEKRRRKQKKSPAELVQIFWYAPTDALFDEEVIAPVIGRARKSLQCDRWRGLGVPYRKCSGKVLYKKADVIEWLESHKLVTSTSEYTSKGGNHAE